MESFHRGYTLYELLITLVLVAILFAVAVPSFANIVASGRIRTEISALFHAVHLARKESIVRRKVVSICPSANGTQCLGGKDWSMGWILFENADRDSPPRVDEGETVLSHHVVDERVRITANRAGFTLRATFMRATNGTMVVCDHMSRISAKALVVSYTGRPRVAVHKRNRELYTCAD